MFKNCIFFLLIFCAIHTQLHAQTERKVAVLDLTVRNAETNQSRILSAMRICEVAGVAFDTTSNLDIALNYPIILFATKVKGSTFDDEEVEQIKAYTSNGGVLIISSLREKDLFEVAGISGEHSSSEHYKLSWDTNEMPELFYSIEDELETTISLGRESSGPNFASKYYTIAGGTILAKYQNDSVASVYNSYGNGACYTFGPDFRDVIYRNMIDGDIGAHRIYSNGFEPTSDVVCFWVRNIFRKHIPNLVRKHTIPGKAKSVTLITHDIDSRTAMDTMLYFSDYEKSQGIIGQYNVTTRYFVDDLMSNFYIGTASLIERVIEDGHTIASHSVGHFPDFAEEQLFPYGSKGNSSSSYQPIHTEGETNGGSIIGELEVSKKVLESDHGVTINSFRTGHLVFPDSLPIGLEETGYLYNSSHSANNVLTSFPYYLPRTRSFNTEQTQVLEIPMTISDVFHSNSINASNYSEKVDTWISATEKYTNNHSPIVLLIHPNRQYKLQAQKDYLTRLPEGCTPFAFEAYGAFWKKRQQLSFRSVLEANQLNIYFENEHWDEQQSFVIDDADLEAVKFYDSEGRELEFNRSNFTQGESIYYFENTVSGITETTSDQQIKAYPNPSYGKITVESDHKIQRAILVDMLGQVRTIFDGFDQTLELNKNQIGLNSGVFILVLEGEDGDLDNIKLVWKE